MKHLIDKFLNGTITPTELRELKRYLNDPKQRLMFDMHLNELHSINTALEDEAEHDLAYKMLIEKIENTQTVKPLYIKVLKYAAILIVLIGLGYLYKNYNQTPQSQLEIANEKITLELENGTIQVIDETGISSITDAKGDVVGNQNENQITYQKEAAVAQEELIYNTLTIPYGKRFKIQLSDRTIVNLNSGTTIKYPVKFIEGHERKVFLKGEAFFNVTEDKAHPFIVNTDAVDIRVLGTQFNVSSYPEDYTIKTVLAEGKVSVYENDKPYSPEAATKLEPGFSADWQKEKNTIVVEEADIEMSTAWIKGKVIFRYMTFETIIKKLERHYNVVIINNNKSLAKERFAATFDTETIEEVLMSFKKNYQINYSIKNNLIIID